MDDIFPFLVLGSGLYMSALLKMPKLRAAFRTRHPLGDRLARAEKTAAWMLVIGALWCLQVLLQG